MRKEGHDGGTEGRKQGKGKTGKSINNVCSPLHAYE